MPKDYWYNLDTREVEEGDGTNVPHLMGPYPTREAAAQALAHAAENTRRWDAEEDEDDLER